MPRYLKGRTFPLPEQLTRDTYRGLIWIVVGYVVGHLLLLWVM